MFGFLEHTREKCTGCETLVEKGVGDHRARFHSFECRRQFYAAQFKASNPTSGLPTGTVGAVGELKVALDLLTKGFYVFTSLSPAAPCDLLITKNGRVFRVEVKTAYRRPNGQVTTSKPKHNGYDLLALAFKDGSIEYRPPLSELEGEPQDPSIQRARAALERGPLSIGICLRKPDDFA